jgi:RHS repeat-associated protein
VAAAALQADPKAGSLTVRLDPAFAAAYPVTLDRAVHLTEATTPAVLGALAALPVPLSPTTTATGRMDADSPAAAAESQPLSAGAPTGAPKGAGLAAPLPLTAPRRGVRANGTGCSTDHGRPADAITLTYDCLAPVGQLLTVQAPTAQIGASEYWYDRAGNRTQRTQGPDASPLTTTYAYDKADRPTAAGAVAVTVNENGNLARRLGGTVDETFTYDQADRLVGAVIAEGGTPYTTAYTYDGDGLRRAKSSTLPGSAAAGYVHDVNRGLPLLLDDGTRSYVWGPPATNLGLLYAIDRSGNVLAYHANGRGGVVGLTDATRAVVQTYITDEYGVPTVQQGTVGTAQPFLFTGEPYDDETNLLHLRARFYDPGTGRFLTRDPFFGGLAAPPTLNRFVYAGNNPASLADPSGFSGWFPRPPSPFEEWLDNKVCTDPLSSLFCFLFGVRPQPGPGGTLGMGLDPLGNKPMEFGGDDIGARASNGLGDAAGGTRFVRDEAYTASRHTMGGSQVQRALRRGEEAHVFNESVDLSQLEGRVWSEGFYQGEIRGWHRWYLHTDSPIGRRVQAGRQDVALSTVEVKARLVGENVWEYHLVPRSRPAG